MKDLLVTWRLRRAAQAHFGWSALRAGQLRGMRAVMRGRDALVVLPTGAGKSAIYQVPATLLDGPTVVISPLLALQQDQVTALNEREGDRTRAVAISSAQSPNAREAALDAVRRGWARLVFITPEQLAQPHRHAQVRELRPALVAVDEAHCISAWGHDFRPDYLTLGRAIDALAPPPRGLRRWLGGGPGRPPVVALTATASPPVRDDITRRLRLRSPQVVIGGLDRPNLFIEVTHCPTEEHRWRRLLAVLTAETRPGCGIVYAPTRRSAEELARRLVDSGYQAAAYHGGLATSVRTRLHEEFLSDRVPVMVATSAFGMGIDKPDIRWVVHLALPDSPDSYLQEIGRAGRDGQPARAVLLHRPEDVALRRYLTGTTVAETDVRDLVAVLRERPRTRAQLREVSGFGERKLGRLLRLLEEVAAVVANPEGCLSIPDDAPVPVATARLALAEANRQRAVQRSRIDMMRAFADGRACRGQALLAYFGDRLDAACGHCDNCHAAASEPARSSVVSPASRRGGRTTWAAARTARGGRAGRAPSSAVIDSAARHPGEPLGANGRDGRPPAAATPWTLATTGPSSTDAATPPFPLHTTVHHRAWGPGTVLGYTGDRMTVLFDEVGYKTLSLAVVRKQNLLSAESD